MSIRFGIDLGIIDSKFTYYEEPNRRVDGIDLANEDDGRILPSVVFFPQGSDEIVGGTGKRLAQMDESRVVRKLKRSMGTDCETAPIGGKAETATEVATIILKTLAADAMDNQQHPAASDDSESRQAPTQSPPSSDRN